jgi:hypothetical protein
LIDFLSALISIWIQGQRLFAILQIHLVELGGDFLAVDCGNDRRKRAIASFCLVGVIAGT